MNFGEQLCDQLVELGYTHCFFLAGGNVMHLVEACRTRFTMVPVIHEVSAVIATEYFNETSDSGARAFAVVTAGPGLTNSMTGLAGAWLESREVLVLGGQVKSADLARNGVRQMGIQELDGVAVAAPITKAAVRIEHPIPMADFCDLVRAGRTGRPGPVFLEICLDAQAAPVAHPGIVPAPPATPTRSGVDRLPDQWLAALAALDQAERPVILLGGGISRQAARDNRAALEDLGIPVALTWNALDRLPSDSPVYAGRPNTWGMRWSNLVIQQSDFILALGTRLGLQQTGFAWQHFAPGAQIVHVDVDQAELTKGRPRVTWPIQADADLALTALLAGTSPQQPWASWRAFVTELRQALPVVEEANVLDGTSVVPQVFVEELSRLLDPRDVLVPCSSGGAFTVAMQVFANKDGQIVVSDKGLASMGYGLAGAIGACMANPDRRVILTEGDGGFAQNLQELGTAAVHGLNLKIFVMDNRGYASIRMTQRNYYNGAYIGCDADTGLGLPEWGTLAAAWGIPSMTVDRGWTSDQEVRELLDRPGPVLFTVPVSQEQTYWPKIGSRVLPDGSMASAPLHLMSPPLPRELVDHCMPYVSQGDDR